MVSAEEDGADPSEGGGTRGEEEEEEEEEEIEGMVRVTTSKWKRVQGCHS